MTAAILAEIAHPSLGGIDDESGEIETNTSAVSGSCYCAPPLLAAAAKCSCDRSTGTATAIAPGAATENDPFTRAPDTLWRDVLLRQSGQLAMFAYFPTEPGLN